MLIAHASSTCDVCLESYNEDCSYHAIPCGHVFCLPCLVSTSPARCPLCRHEFSSYSMRKLHLTLPSPRDIACRQMEMKLVQSSPEMTLAESLALFQEIQEWLNGEAQEEFLVLRAFAAVLCSFHETKDQLVQNQALSERREAELKRLLEEARSVPVPQPDVGDYKTKYRTAKANIAALQAEIADLRAQLEQQRQRDLEYHAHYTQFQAQAQAQFQSQSQPQLQAAEVQPASRRISNPLPTPPRPVDIPFLKLIETNSSRLHLGGKGKGRESSSHVPVDADPMSSAFVPTLSATIPARHHDANTDGRPEVTTLVFKPPKRMSIWSSPAVSYTSIDDPVWPPPLDRSDHPNSSRPVSDAGASVGVGPAAPGPGTVDSAPPSDSEPHQRPDVNHNSRTLFHRTSLGGHGWAESSSHAVPPASVHHPLSHDEASSRRMLRRDTQGHGQARESSYPVSASVSMSQPQPPAVGHAGARPTPLSELGALPPAAAMRSMSPVLDRPPSPPTGFAKMMRRPAWQGGTGTAATAPRRASSSPVMVAAAGGNYAWPGAGQNLQVVVAAPPPTVQGSCSGSEEVEGRDVGGMRNRRMTITATTGATRPYTMHDALGDHQSVSREDGGRHRGRRRGTSLRVQDEFVQAAQSDLEPQRSVTSSRFGFDAATAAAQRRGVRHPLLSPVKSGGKKEEEGQDPTVVDASATAPATAATAHGNSRRLRSHGPDPRRLSHGHAYSLSADETLSSRFFVGLAPGPAPPTTALPLIVQSRSHEDLHYSGLYPAQGVMFSSSECTVPPLPGSGVYPGELTPSSSSMWRVNGAASSQPVKVGEL